MATSCLDCLDCLDDTVGALDCQAAYSANIWASVSNTAT